MPASPEESGDIVDGASNPLMAATRTRPKLSKPPGQPGTANKAKGSESDTRQSRASIGSREAVEQRSSSQQRNAKRNGPQKRAKSVSSSRLEQKSDTPETTSHGRKTPPPIVRPRDLPSPKGQSNISTPTGSSDPAGHLVERLEKLASQHEALLATHSTLTEQHSALLVRHETVLTALEQLVSSGFKVDGVPAQSASGGDKSSPNGKGSAASESNGSNGSRLRRIGSAPAGNKQNSASDSKAAPIPSPRASFIRPPSLPSTSQSNNKSGSISPGRVLPRRSGTPNKGGSSGSSGNNGTTGALSNHAAAAGHSLRVVVRKRPAAEDEVDCVEVLDNGGILVHEDKVKVDLTKYVQHHRFGYDDTFGSDDVTRDLYARALTDLMDNFFGGGNSTCFCFGQTASGKTFTLFGSEGGNGQATSSLHNGNDDDEANSSSYHHASGLYLLAGQKAFQRLQHQEAADAAPVATAAAGVAKGRTHPPAGHTLQLTVSMFEIYGQKVRDLLGGGKELPALEDGKGVLQLVGLTAVPCADMTAFVHATNSGRAARTTNATATNATSSRSHAALLLKLVRQVLPSGGASSSSGGAGSGTSPSVDNSSVEVLGRFSLIDLAGSERGADNDNTDKTTQMEGRQINQSLLALKEVIRAKELGRSHAPFRQSRLTQVLEESLTGSKCHTCVVGCVSPAARDLQQTLNTLRYAEGMSPHHGKRTLGAKRNSNGSDMAEATAPMAAAAASSSVSITGSSDGGYEAQGTPFQDDGSQLLSPEHSHSARQSSLELMEFELGADWGAIDGSEGLN